MLGVSALPTIGHLPDEETSKSAPPMLPKRLQRTHAPQALYDELLRNAITPAPPRRRHRSYVEPRRLLGFSDATTDDAGGASSSRR